MRSRTSLPARGGRTRAARPEPGGAEPRPPRLALPPRPGPLRRADVEPPRLALPPRPGPLRRADVEPPRLALPPRPGPLRGLGPPLAGREVAAACSLHEPQGLAEVRVVARL